MFLINYLLLEDSLERKRIYLKSAVFLSFHDVQYDGSNDVEALTIADLVVPASVRQ